MHYLDNSATTAVSDAAARKALEIMTDNFGNPSSLHTLGINAEHELEEARVSVARAVGADSGEITFTSGGTEANNLAVFGAAEAKRRTCRKLNKLWNSPRRRLMLHPRQRLISTNNFFVAIYISIVW